MSYIGYSNLPSYNFMSKGGECGRLNLSDELSTAPSTRSTHHATLKKIATIDWAKRDDSIQRSVLQIVRTTADFDADQAKRTKARSRHQWRRNTLMRSSPIESMRTRFPTCRARRRRAQCFEDRAPRLPIRNGTRTTPLRTRTHLETNPPLELTRNH